MRVVVDTNVFISAALKEQSLPGMAAHIVAKSGLLLKSTITERELFVTLARPRLASLIPPRFRDWPSELLAAAELVAITERITACRDPKDDKFLELAVNGHADLIVSGDADLLALNPFRGIPIVTPAAFVRCWRDKSGRWLPQDP
jgi:putative PIN family toxin of toxin-antitoxin system